MRAIQTTAGDILIIETNAVVWIRLFRIEVAAPAALRVGPQ